MKPLLLSSGEPAGIGPDICLALAAYELPIVVLADKEMLRQRADFLQLSIDLLDYKPHLPFQTKANSLTVYHLPCAAPVKAGQLNSKNSIYVLNMLSKAVECCLSGEFSGLITAPIHKAIINTIGVSFTGHTEFLAHHCGVETVVMMLACDIMKMALVTTHLPLSQVASSLTIPLIQSVINQLHSSLENDFGIITPRIHVAGLNPHAGEGGYLGREEIDIIEPALKLLQQQGINVQGPYPADTLFNPKNLQNTDVFVAMYHDQGLPVLKYAGFGKAVNITLGLPIIRTSVDHGTALELAGTGCAEAGSLIEAVQVAISMVKQRAQDEKN
jgi:4-hydroxythreonine-4-phosphate dehydrogenase